MVDADPVFHGQVQGRSAPIFLSERREVVGVALSITSVLDGLMTVRTVTGEIAPEDIGTTLIHEHVIHNLNLHSGKADNVVDDADLVAGELAAFRKAGGRTICDLTPAGVGRSPRTLKEIADRTGLNIVSGMGLYQLDVIPPEILSRSRQELADFFVREATGGDTGIQAGIFGEITSHNEDHADWQRYRLLDKEVEIFQAVAQAQQRTGLSIYTHASFGRGGVAQLRVLTEAGALPDRIIIGHCDALTHEDMEKDMSYYHELLDGGACLAFDMFRWDEVASDADRFKRVAALVAEGFTERVVISTDTCRLSQMHTHGGRGFDYLFTDVMPGLCQAGLTQRQIEQIVVKNPARILTRQNS